MDDNFAWLPDETSIEHANLSSAIKHFKLNDYPELYHYSLSHFPELLSFYLNHVAFHWQKKPEAILNASDSKHPQWLPGAKFNLADSCLRESDKIAITQSNENGKQQRITYTELTQRVNQLSNKLANKNIKKSSHVAIIMPMTIDAVVCYLALLKLGAIVVAIAESFSEKAIKDRLDIVPCDLIITQGFLARSGKQLPLYQRICNSTASSCLVLNADDLALRNQDINWQDFITTKSNEVISSTPMRADETIAVIFSSGTTSTPKAIPWNSSSALRAAFDGFFHQDIHPEDTVCWPTSLGWMMGHWLVFASLLNGATLALFDGAPTHSGFGEFVEQERISVLGVVPSLVRAWRQKASMEKFDWSAIRLFSSSGEVANADDSRYLMQLANNKPIIEYCGGTEISGAYVTSTILQANMPAAFSTPALGTKFLLLDENFQTSESGEVFLCPPSLGFSQTLLNKDHEATYYADLPAGPNGELLRKHGDHLMQLSNGYYRALGRCDDSMNLGGVKTSSAEIEQCLLAIHGIKELAAIGFAEQAGGPEQLIIFAVADCANQTALQQEMQQAIRQQLNPLFKIKQLVLLNTLPKTSSNKIIRKQLKQILQEEKHIELNQ